jgi:membrane-associated protein
MPYLRFLPFSVCGGIGSVFLLTMLGYTLGKKKLVHDHFDVVILGIIFLSLLPTVIHAVRERRRARLS